MSGYLSWLGNHHYKLRELKEVRFYGYNGCDNATKRIRWIWHEKSWESEDDSHIWHHFSYVELKIDDVCTQVLRQGKVDIQHDGSMMCL